MLCYFLIKYVCFIYWHRETVITCPMLWYSNGTDYILTTLFVLVHRILFFDALCIFQQQQKRQKLLTEVCAKYFPSNNRNKNAITTRVNREKGIVYCAVPKVSTQFIIHYHHHLWFIIIIIIIIIVSVETIFLDTFQYRNTCCMDSDKICAVQ